MGLGRTLFGMLAAAGAAGAAAGRWGHRRARQRYEDALERALADGLLTDEELQELERRRAEEHLSAEEVHLVGRSIYRKALRSAAEDQRLTEEEEGRLATLQSLLGLSDAEIATDERQYARLRLLAAVERGRLLPEIESPFALGPGERPHWLVRATAGEELALPGHRVRSRGQRFPLPGREVYDVQDTRSALEPDGSFLPRDVGLLVVTDRRTVFRGARQRTELRHEDLTELVAFADGVGMVDAEGSLRLYLVDDAELTGAIVYQAARRRQLGLDQRPSQSA
jgi:hypothetical protein